MPIKKISFENRGKSEHVVHVSDRTETDSIKSDSSNSSLGFGDFENGTIYDQVVKMDAPACDTDIIDGDLWSETSAQGTKYDSVQLQNSSGVIIGNQTFIEGTVIFDRFVANDDLMERLQQNKSIGDGNGKVDLPKNGKRESNGRNNDTKSESDFRKPKSNLKKPVSKCKKVIIITVVIVILVIVLSVGAVLIFHYLKKSDGDTTTTLPPTSPTVSTEPTTTEDSSTETSTTEPTTPPPPLTYTFVSRSEWGASHPSYDLESISHPAKSIVITETFTNPCATNETCIKIARDEQKKFLGMAWEDIGHSFLAAGYNAIYEGRGWNASGQHTNPARSNCYVIAFIGKFASRRPTQEQIDAYMALIEDGVRKKYIHKDYEMVAHCQLTGVSRPGIELRKLMETWPHWTNTTKQC